MKAYRIESSFANQFHVYVGSRFIGNIWQFRNAASGIPVEPNNRWYSGHSKTQPDSGFATKEEAADHLFTEHA